MTNIDTFLVGDGSHVLMEKYREKDYFSEQLVGVSDVSDLKSVLIEDAIIVSENDLEDFSADDVIIVEDYEKVFIICKKKAYKIFDYLAVKSSKMGEEPIQEKDLILTEDDKNLISYLKTKEIEDYASVDKIATLSALQEMRVSKIRFRSIDNCPICSAYDKCILSIEEVYRPLLLGNGFPHQFADFDVSPVIYKQFDSTVEGKAVMEKHDMFRKVPAEYVQDLEDLGKFIKDKRPDFNKEIVFADIIQHCIENSIGDFSGVILLEEEDKIVVYDSYVDSMSPIDFLYEYFKSEEITQVETTDIAKAEDSESYYINGIECFKYEDSYWNTETGKKVK